MSTIIKYWHIAFISARSHLAYFGEVVSRILFLAIILFIFMRLWQTTYSETHATVLGGLSLAQMLWYLAIAESIILSGPRVAAIVDEDIRTGALAIQLVRPLSYPLYRLAVTLGERTVRFILNLTLASFVAFVLVGPIHIHSRGLAMFSLLLPLAFVVDFLGNFFIGTCAFWLEDTSGLLLIYSRVTMIIGGMLVPLELFPETLRRIASALPFASIVYGPAHMFVSPDVHLFEALIVQQVASLIAFALAVYWLYSHGVRRIHAHGG